MKKISTKKPGATGSIVDKYLEYKADFLQVCEDYHISPEVGPDTFEYLLEIGDEFMHACFCSYFQDRYNSANGISKDLGKKVTEGMLSELITINQSKEELTDQQKKNLYKKVERDLFNANLMKYSIDSKMADRLANTSKVVYAQDPKLPLGKSTMNSRYASALLTDLVDSKKIYDQNREYFDKILHSLVFVTDGALSDKDAKKILMKWKHLPLGGFKCTKNQLMKTCEDIALAYRYIAKNNIKLDEGSRSVNPKNLDGLNMWLEKHGLKLVELENYETADKDYAKFVEEGGFNKSWKEKWGK